MKKKIDYEMGSGNVFADIGLPKAEEHLVKAQLVFRIDGLMKKRGFDVNLSVKNIHDFKFEDFELVGYDPHPGIKAPVAV